MTWLVAWHLRQPCACFGVRMAQHLPACPAMYLPSASDSPNSLLPRHTGSLPDSLLAQLQQALHWQNVPAAAASLHKTSCGCELHLIEQARLSGSCCGCNMLAWFSGSPERPPSSQPPEVPSALDGSSCVPPTCAMLTCPAGKASIACSFPGRPACCFTGVQMPLPAGAAASR